VTQQLRNATPAGAAPRFLIRDRDDKFGSAFDVLARATGIRMVRTAVRAPNMNAVCERFLGSLRRECLDHVLVLAGHHFQRVVAEYVRHHNDARPHQGIHQQTPVPAERPAAGSIVTLPVLAGLHHEYRRAA
jgi:putative transposase